MTAGAFDALVAQMKTIKTSQTVGRVIALGRQSISVGGIEEKAALGDRVEIGTGLFGEVVRIEPGATMVMPEGSAEGVRLHTAVRLMGPARIAPHHSWMGRVIDPDGAPLDGKPLFPGAQSYALKASPPRATARRGMGARLSTGFAVFDTFLPIVQGQRVGIFAGSGVGKSHLLGALAQTVTADVVVIGLIGERGREVRDYVEKVLGPEGLKRTVVVAATSDRPAPSRARAAYTMMAIAEYFRDQGQQVLLLADSVTRFVEAQREIAAAAGEPFGPNGFPASMAQMVMSLVERAGPGEAGCGDITAVLTVLVAASDMEGPVADVMRGVLDGHIVLDRSIAERNRFPAVDILRSVSRALPDAASAQENQIIATARRLFGAYDASELMVKSGLYSAGSDPLLDVAVALYPKLDAFLAQQGTHDPAESFKALAELTRPAANL